MMQMLFVFLTSYTLLVDGFLLDSQNPQVSTGQTGSNQHYVTVSDFLDEKKQQQKGSELLYHEIEQLRHDTDQSLSVLTSQIRDKLDTFEQKMAKTTCCNESKILEQNYNELIRNYTVLNKEFETLQTNFLRQKQELERVKNTTLDLESVQHSNEFNQKMQNLQNNFTVQQQELINIKNTTNQLHGDIQKLNQLKNIKPIQDIHGLQQEVQSISALTHNLKVNEQARTQDFLALYNVTVQSKQSIIDLKKKTEQNSAELNQNIQNQSSICLQKVQAVENVLNRTTGLLSGQITELDKMSNSTLLLVQEQGNKIVERVAVTACVNSYLGVRPSGYIIRFADIRNQVGIRNISSLVSSGQFICETGGLYLVSAWVVSQIRYSEYAVMKNNHMLVRAYVSHNPGYPDTATAVVAVELQPGDRMWIQTTSKSNIYNRQGDESCLTILKVK